MPMLRSSLLLAALALPAAGPDALRAAGYDFDGVSALPYARQREIIRQVRAGR